MAGKAEGRIACHFELLRLGKLNHGTKPSQLHRFEAAFLFSISIRLAPLSPLSTRRNRYITVSLNDHLTSLPIPHSKDEPSIRYSFAAAPAMTLNC
jgi:hypothetical protein